MTASCPKSPGGVAFRELGEADGVKKLAANLLLGILGNLVAWRLLESPAVRSFLMGSWSSGETLVAWLDQDIKIGTTLAICVSLLTVVWFLSQLRGYLAKGRRSVLPADDELLLQGLIGLPGAYMSEEDMRKAMKHLTVAEFQLVVHRLMRGGLLTYGYVADHLRLTDRAKDYLDWRRSTSSRNQASASD